MKLALTILFVSFHLHLWSQFYDGTWICGNYATTLTFTDSIIDTARILPLVGGLDGWASICDSSGNLEFFTEGVNVYSYDGTPMFNGQQLADNSVDSYYYFGLPDGQNELVLPKKSKQYYIIYQSQSDPDFATHPWYYTNNLYYAVVDMSLQNGKGEVTQKRVPLNSTYFMDGHLTACQHANGRDWWLVQRGYNNNRYFIYLVTPDSIVLKHEQFIGAVSQEPDRIGQSEFSPDGSKYATITGKSPLIVMDFDRCTGIFSNPLSINVPVDSFMFYNQLAVIGAGGNGLCFSPNGRLLYMNSSFILRQFDLSNTLDTGQIIFFWTDSNEYLGQFNQMHLGPNGKIYIASYQGFTYALHQINYPDSAGLSCSFVKWGQPIAATSAHEISNVLHYRMGPLVGSACDTLHTNIAEAPADIGIGVFPNPADDVVHVELNSYDLYNPQQQVYLYDNAGRLVRQIALPYLSAELSVKDLPNGVYEWKVAVGGKVNAEGKLVVRH